MAPISCTEPTAHFSSGCELLRHYDADNDGIISYAESVKATQDYYDGIITQGEAEFVITAYQKGSINAVCPGCYTTPTPTPTPISCTEPTAHFSSGCELLRHYDADNDGIISYAESVKATQDYYDGIITQGEAEFVITAYQKGSINAVCPGCYTTPTPVPAGDITRVELDGELLPENGTLEWTVNKQARVKVYFRNVGTAASRFRIAVAYNGDAICDLETDAVPADGREYYVDDCVFTPDETGTHTIKVTITP